MIRQKRFMMMLVLVLALAASACQAKPAGTTQQLQTATVTRGSLQATVSAAGTIAAPAQVAVQFQNSGQVVAVNVKVGDQVKAGQVMASLDSTSLEAALASAQAGLDMAQAQLAATQKGPLASQVKSDEAALASAQAAFRAAQAKTTNLGDQLVIDQNNLDNAATELNNAQNAYSNLFEFVRSGNPRGAYVPPAGQQWSSQKAALDDAKINYEVAVATYNLDAANVNNSSLASAAAQVAQAQANLDDLKSTPTPQDVQLAELSVQNAQLALDQAKLNLTKSQLIAPFDGVVAQVNLQAGQQSSDSAQPVILANLSQLEAQVLVAETDVPRVKVGQPVQVTFDALPNQTFDASVVEVAYVGTVTSGVVNYPVTIALDQPGTAAALSASQQIRPGMTANVTIVVEQRDNILLVPNRAIKLSGKQRVVTVLKDGQPTQVNVTLGMSGDTESEVVSGLNEGDAVVVPQTTTTTGQGGGGFGGPGGGFGRGFGD
jgi:HlyD family secretion protein